MTLYLRLLIIMVKILFGPRKHPLEKSVVNFRVLPTDCDLNFHMTSARYAAFTEAATIHLMGQMEILDELLKRRCFPINNAINVTYIRSIKPFEKFTVVSRIIAWDDKYWYKDHRFEVDGELRAYAIARGVVICRRAVASISDIVALTGEDLVSPPFPENVLMWKEFLDTKKVQAS